MATERQVRNLMDCFRKLVQALRSSHRAAEHLHMTGAQLFVLKVIGDSDVPLTINEVAERTITDQSTVSVVATRLAERGLIERSRSEKDSRRVYVLLTAKGRAMYNKAPVTIASRRLADVLGSLSAREASTLRDLLERIVSAVGESDEAPGLMFDDERRRRSARH